MDNNKMKQLKEKYEDIPIPTELDEVVKKALQKRKSKNSGFKWVAGVAAAAVIFTSSINISPAFAKSLESIPVVGSIVDVLTFTEFTVDEGNYQADIKVPAIDKLENKELEQTLNEKYLMESQELYTKFMDEMKGQKAFGVDGHLRVDSGFVVKTDTDQLLTVGRYVQETAASSKTTIKYDTIDKENQLLVTLPSLFKDDSYIAVISENIIKQMKQQMKEDEAKSYFIASEEELGEGFTEINKEQNFYINAEHKLVVSFNDYEVAPGYMGTVEFVIPTDEIKDILVSNAYIK
ncbi:RsiV family protein [Ornithinibacillus bavariensis]|uniref:Anti-sigma-V factor RsiV n=1 Tax=Ornithinibacillus bavariensis TaxID=545502 RepID=A0A919XC47_9BACI|nr:RsiV family protein [Ornithinibacillus bavariensis]GIO27950.1 anti-sigma-V factor RsiV [Ornithinibacillus bavariensis]